MSADYLYEPKIIAATSMPVGTILLWGTDNDLRTADDSEEWMICDGRKIPNGSSGSTTDYETLYGIIGDNFGEGDNGTFNIPDMRGRFVRGTNKAGKQGAANLDPDAANRTAMQPGGNVGDEVGTIQADALQQHQHNVAYQPFGKTSGGQKPESGPDSCDYYTNTITIGDVSPATVRVSTETRPVNAYLNFLIKAKG